jgi:membrane-bound lytic murein transglycosylase D
MPSTGRRFGLHQDWWVDERSDPQKATLAAARYLKELHGLFGDWNLALAGYNAGEQKILRAIDRYGVRDFWELRRTAALRRETRNYVPMIHAAIIMAKAPEKYGLTPASTPASEFEFVPLRSALDLRVVAECADTTLDQIRDLNPELRRLVTPAVAHFDVRVPRGRGLTALDCLARLPAEKRTAFRTHVVARGQTLASIARQHATRIGDIAEANGISPRQRLAVGATLILPTATHPGEMRAQPAAGDRDRTANGDAVLRHRIQPGDTLAALAARYGTTVRALQEWNDLKGSHIAVGRSLIVRRTRPL